MKNGFKYSLELRILHWLMSFAIIGMIISGWVMTELDNNIPYKWDLYKMHKSFGVALLILVIIRILARLKNMIPPYEINLSPIILKMATLIHYTLYILMFMVPLSGVLMSYFGGYGVPFFSYNLPVLLPENKELASLMNNTHQIIAYIFLLIISLHVLAALKHLIIDKYNIFSRII